MSMMFGPLLVAAEEMTHELPMPAWMFGAIALVAFALLLGLTWAFRGTATKWAQAGDGAGNAHGSSAAPDEGHH